MIKNIKNIFIKNNTKNILQQKFPGLIIIEYNKLKDFLKITCNRGYESRVANSLFMFQKAFNKIRNDIDRDFCIYINTDDYTEIENINMLSYSSTGGKNIILIPDYIFINWPEIGIKNYDEMCNEIEMKGYKNYKYDKLLWIGNVQTHKSRQILMDKYAKNQKFELYGMNWEKDSLNAETLTATKYISLPDHTEYKYLLDVQGRGYSGRVKLLLFSSRPLFYVERECEEYYSKDLKPFIHYIPIKADLSDLEEKFDWAEANYKKATEIAENALNYAKQNLKTENAINLYSNILLNILNK